MRIAFDHPAARRRTSDSLVLRLTVDGADGIGECAPRRYVTGETSDGVAHALRRHPMEVLFDRLVRGEPAALLAELREQGFTKTFGGPRPPADGSGNNLLCLLETAVLDLLTRRLGLPAGAAVSTALPRREVRVSQVLDLSMDVGEFLDTRGPFHFVKVKASDDLDRDVRTVAAIRDRLGPDVPVMVDANMSWTPAGAARHAERLREAGAGYVEEPLPPRSWRALRDLRRATGLRVMLDESVCTLADARQAATAEACDALNVRVAKNGGLLASARLVAFARSAGLGFQIGVQVAETGPLINAGRALALRCPDALAVEAGQSDRFFPEMIVSPPPVVDRIANTVAPVTGPGFGLRLNERAEPWAALSWTADGWRSVAPSHPAPVEESAL
ncbi:mandelate racemase [Streptomyces actuosus]|uniref:Mandelate racemase n=2 Tax=Streptomyces actuosus TaxID=1885 RepID=A0ABS2VSL8_STRAS|nr:mandelate racemase [Streptomyces actuosus]